MSSVLQIYRTFGLGSSYTSVMKFGCLLQYSEYGAVDRDFPDVPPRLLEDIYQVQVDDAAHTLSWHWCDGLNKWCKPRMYEPNLHVTQKWLWFIRTWLWFDQQGNFQKNVLLFFCHFIVMYFYFSKSSRCRIKNNELKEAKILTIAAESANNSLWDHSPLHVIVKRHWVIWAKLKSIKNADLMCSVFFFRWEVTFCWMKRGRPFFVTRVKTLWTGQLWKTSCRLWTQQSCDRWALGVIRGLLTHNWHHRGRAALWLTFMTPRLALMTPWRGVTDAEL